MKNKPLTIYEYKNCGTCKKAIQYLDRKGLAYERIPIREQPPTLGELQRMAESMIKHIALVLILTLGMPLLPFSAVAQTSATPLRVGELPKHLALDIKESFWGWGALGLAVGAGITAGLWQYDHAISADLTQHAIFGTTGNTIFDHLGAPYTMAGASLVTTIVGTSLHDDKLQTTGESMMESLFLSELIVFGAKYAFHRTRPDGEKHSFPSGHTVGVFSSATVLQMMYGWKFGVPAYALASAVALSRVDAHTHFPSDVVMAAALGTVLAYGTSRLHKRLHNHFMTIVPNCSNNQYGLLLSRDF